MPRTDVEFKTHDGVTLRGWFITPAHSEGKVPCLVMCHGWTAVKEMDLDAFAEHFASKLPIACLVFDNRGFGASDAAGGQPRLELIPSVQISDIQDAVTYAQSRDEVNAEKIGIWGSSYSGGHVLNVASIDKRVKAVISQVPLVDGKENFRRLVRSDFQPGMYQLFQQGMSKHDCYERKVLSTSLQTDSIAWPASHQQWSRSLMRTLPNQRPCQRRTATSSLPHGRINLLGRTKTP